MKRRPSMQRCLLGLAALCITLTAAAAPASAGDDSAQGHRWPRFRGPNGTGISDAQTVPVQWSEPDYNWTLDLPGRGHASPVVWGDRLFVTATKPDAERWLLLCVDAHEGEILWQRSEPLPPYRKHRYNSFASATPAVDEHHVYAVRSTPEEQVLLAVDHEGDEVWRRDLGGLDAMHGSGASPIVYGDKVILANDQRGESFLVAVDRMTGETAWKTPRNSGNTAYSTPSVYRPDGGPEQLLFTAQASGITGVDPETGRVLWELPDVFDKRAVLSPMVAGGLVFGSCGSGGGGNYVVAARPGGGANSDAANGSGANSGGAEVAYTMDTAAPYVPTPVAVGDLLFLVSDAGIATCLHAPTGRVEWRERLNGNFFSSPVCVDGKLYCVKRNGEVVVFRASDEFERLAVNDLGGPSHATPAVAHGRMYLRTVDRLISIGGATGE